MDKLKSFVREVGESCGLPSNPPLAMTPMGHEDIGMYVYTFIFIILFIFILYLFYYYVVYY